MSGFIIKTIAKIQIFDENSHLYLYLCTCHYLSLINIYVGLRDVKVCVISLKINSEYYIIVL